MVRIKTFNSREEAEVAKSFLEANGILSVIQADDQGGMQPSLARTSGVDLKVREEDARTAIQLLDGTNESGDL